MGSTDIGKNILRLRKEKGITQEKLAKEVGVTAQAVSKWETGGAPDIDTITAVADFFEVSIDKLFGRSVSDYDNFEKEIAKSIVRLPVKERLKKAYEYCWAIEASIMSGDADNIPALDEIPRKNDYKIFSQVITNEGFTFMSLYTDLNFFYFMPEPECGWEKEIGFKDEYLSLFKFLSNTYVLKTIIYLFSRDSKPFTSKLIEEVIGMSNNEAEEILKTLLEYKLIDKSELELDDELIEIYKFEANPAFIAMLAFCNSLIEKPNSFHYYLNQRDKPYL